MGKELLSSSWWSTFACPVLLHHPSQHLLALGSRTWPARAALAAWPGVEAASPWFFDTWTPDTAFTSAPPLRPFRFLCAVLSDCRFIILYVKLALFEFLCGFCLLIRTRLIHYVTRKIKGFINFLLRFY